MAFVCLECGCVFDEPRTFKETHGLEHGPYETWHGCPVCGGAYDEQVYCEGCGEYMPASEAHETKAGYFCDDCYYDNGLTEDD